MGCFGCFGLKVSMVILVGNGGGDGVLIVVGSGVVDVGIGDLVVYVVG